jgi:hypothetical protein
MTSTNLSNLARIGLLDPVPFSRELVARMMAAVQQRLRDAEFAQNSNETRFDCAYTALRTMADIGLHLKGYRTSTSKPGHHQTAIQCLALTVGVEESVVRILDSLRKQRNVTDYEGDLVTAAALRECLSQAHALLERIKSDLDGDSRFDGDK